MILLLKIKELRNYYYSFLWVLEFSLLELKVPH